MDSVVKTPEDYGVIYKPDKAVIVIKKDGTKEPFNVQKVIIAIEKSAYRALTKFTDEEKRRICQTVVDKINEIGNNKVPISLMHNIVEKALEDIKPIVAKSYRDYRNYKQDFVRMMDDVFKSSQAIMYVGDKENANTDSALVSTKRSLIFNQFNKELYQKFFMTTEELQACREGYIYVHDMSARRDTMNCCLADITAILTGGFEMGNVWYNEPKTLDTAFDVISDLVLSMASQQYGGYTLPEVDKILEPYAKRSFEKYVEKYMTELGVSREKAEEVAMKDVERDFEQGFQGWEYKFNTVASSRGDYPFITVTAGLSASRFGKMASITMLNVRKKGQGKKGHKKPVLFPKIVFLYDENLHGEGKELEDVFNAGVACSMKTMYPDWLSLTGEGYVPGIYKKYGMVISPMGCVDGQEIITYRWNGKLYIESFKRMWDRLAEVFEVKVQPAGPEHLYMDLTGITIYDKTKGFVAANRIIRNTSDKWVDLHLSNGRRLLCTTDHPITTAAGITKHACELTKDDQIVINSNQYSEETVDFDADKAWLLGFMLCDSCYDPYGIFASIALDSENEIEEKFHELFPKYFGLETRTLVQMREEKGNYKDLRAYSDHNGGLQKAMKYLVEMFGGKGKKDRQIPNEVFSWNRSAKLAFMAGIIDADGYLNPTSHGGSVVQLGSTNKELALQQMALAQALGIPAKIYYNRYNKKHPDKIRYRVEFFATKKLSDYLVCEKKKECFKERSAYSASDINDIAEVMEVKTIERTDFSYDVSTESEHFDVSGIWSHNCRAFLSPWYERGGMYPADDDDKPVFVGRFNIGAVSLHLPMILAKARQEGRDFYEVLDYYLNMIRQLHIRTYAYLGEMRASTNPLGYCEGGFLGGHLGLHDKIKPLLKPMTASFGITALNELQMLYNKKSLVEDGQFALEVLQYINDKVNEYKQEDGNLYAIYGTPAENLCGLQVKQFRAKYGIIEGVSDREYVTNSFHCHVSEDLTPIEKQNLEFRFWNLCNGGKIQYVKYPIDYNIIAVKTLIRRAMDMGFYEGVNMSLAYCENCGHQELEMDVCPKCGSRDLTKIDRMNGYLAYSRVHGDTRLNEAKMAEIAERKSM